MLAGDRLIARVDLKADWQAQKLYVLSQRFEAAHAGGAAPSEDGAAVRAALARYAGALGLQPVAS